MPRTISTDGSDGHNQWRTKQVVQYHFSQQDWIDYVRGLQGERTAELADHLNSCIACARTVAVWRSVVRVATDDWKNAPPRHAIESAKAAFVLRRLPVRGSWPMRFAQIILDSAFAPLPAGVRSGHGESRHMILGADDMRIELMIEPVPGAHEAEIAITGQIIPEVEPVKPLSSTRVLLTSADTVAATTFASKNGEFALNGRSDGPGWLVFDTEGERTVAARLPWT